MSRLDIKTPSKAQMVVEHLYRSMEHRIEASPPGLCPIDMALNFLNLLCLHHILHRLLPLLSARLRLHPQHPLN